MITPPVYTLRGLRADQVLTSEAFGLPTTRNPDIAGKLEKFRRLYLKEKRTSEETEEFLKLRDILEENLPESAEDVDTRLMQSKLKKMLENLEMAAAARGVAHD